MRAAVLHGALFSFCGTQLRGRVRGLRARVGVLQLQEQLAPGHMFAFVHKDPVDSGGGEGAGFEVLYRLDLSVGGNLAADGTAFDGGGAHRQCPLAVRESENQHDYEKGRDYERPAAAVVELCLSFCIQGVCIQMDRSKIAVPKLPFRREIEHSKRDLSELDAAFRSGMYCRTLALQPPPV